jgi:phasin family protein
MTRESDAKAAANAAAKRNSKAPRSQRPKGARATQAITAKTEAQPKDPIMDTAAKTAKTADFTKTVKDAAADAQTRAKAAYEKFQAYAADATEMSKGNVEALVESGKILGAGLQDFARGEVEAAKGAFETATADLKALAAVKSPTELFKLQGEIARRNFDAAVARASKNAEVSVKLANDAFAPISSRMSLAAERLSNAA